MNIWKGSIDYSRWHIGIIRLSYLSIQYVIERLHARKTELEVYIRQIQQRVAASVASPYRVRSRS